MAKLEGFSKVAVVKYGCCQTQYFFAIYDDGIDYKAGDTCLFSGSSTPAKLVEVISVEEAAKRSSKNITAEVIGRVDVSAYEKRVEQRKEKEKLKKELDKGDYLKMNVKDFAPQVIITNPPFSIATSIIEKALDDVADDGYVIMLLRLNFFGSKDRKPFFDKYMPEWCFVHHIRIGFCDKKNVDGYVEFDKNGQVKRGSTDSIEYAHYVFRKGLKPEYTKLVVI